MLSPATVPHTMLSPAIVPHTMLSPATVPHTMLSPATVPHTVLSPAPAPPTGLAAASVRPPRFSRPPAPPPRWSPPAAGPGRAAPAPWLGPRAPDAAPGGGAGGSARRDVVAGAGLGDAPRCADGERVGVHLRHAGTEAMGAPDDVLAPHLLDGDLVARLRRGVEAGEANRADGVQEAGALRQRVVAGILLRRVLQDRLHRVRRERGIRLQHQRDGAGDDRRRHAGAAEAQIRERRG